MRPRLSEPTAVLLGTNGRDLSVTPLDVSSVSGSIRQIATVDSTGYGASLAFQRSSARGSLCRTALKTLPVCYRLLPDFNRTHPSA